MSDIENLFGDRTWEHVRASITRATVRRWPQMNPYDIEDAVSTAMVDLVDYWLTLGSSVSSDTQRNFAYAVTRGTWKAKAALGERAEEIETSSSLEELDFMMAELDSPIGELAVEPFADYVSDRAPKFQAPSAEEVLFDHLLHDEVLTAINRLSEDELDGWFADFWSGESLVDIAEREKVSPDSVRMRRNRGLDRLANTGL
jgi:DNA-directed RNA polymerase specialized sigma24 family protein